VGRDLDWQWPADPLTPLPPGGDLLLRCWGLLVMGVSVVGLAGRGVVRGGLLLCRRWSVGDVGAGWCP
jgi:hypothetical protein